jgi:hypothetical protein
VLLFPLVQGVQIPFPSDVSKKNPSMHVVQLKVSPSLELSTASQLAGKATHLLSPDLLESGIFWKRAGHSVHPTLSAHLEHF